MMTPLSVATPRMLNDAQLEGMLERLMFKDVARRTMLELPDEDAAGVVFKAAREGGWGVRREGVTIDSTYAPDRQAQARVSAEEFEDAQIAVVIGCGAGALPLAIYEMTADSGTHIAVFEPDPVVLRGAIRREQRLWRCDPHRIQFFSSPQSLKMHLLQQYRPAQGRVVQVCPPSSRRLAPELCDRIPKVVEEAMLLAHINKNTVNGRARQWMDHLLTNLARRTELPSVFALQDVFQGVPAVVVAAGPSLDRNIELLREVQDEVVIIGVNTSFKALIDAGVRPHLVLCLESLNVSVHFEGLEEALGQTALALDQSSHPALFGLPAGHTFGFLNCSQATMGFAARIFGDEGVQGLPSGGSIANAAFSCANMLGCEPIILIGQDLAYTGGRAYASDTVFGDITLEVDGEEGRLIDPGEVKQAIHDASEVSEDHAKFNADRHLFPVTAWGGEGTVLTSIDFDLFRLWFQEAGAHAQAMRPLRLFNATEGGAHIEGFEHVPLAEVLAMCPGVREDRHAVIAELWRGAPRVAPQQWTAGLARAVEDCRALQSRASAVNERIDAASKALKRYGHEHSVFARCVERLGEAESALARVSHDSPLVEGYVKASLDEIMTRLHKEKGEHTSPAHAWRYHLKTARQVNQSIKRAAGDLLSRLERQKRDG